MKKLAPAILSFLLSFPIWGEVVKDSVELRVSIPPVFSLDVEAFIEPPPHQYSEKELVEPSKNEFIGREQSTGESIQLGHLIARRSENGVLPLISEYRVKLRVVCQTNRNHSYVLTQTMDQPLTGTQSGAVFPARAFVCAAEIDRSLGQEKGHVLLTEETSVPVNADQTIYVSGDTGIDYLGNVINVYYWISDSQEDKVMATQRADTYRSTLTLTMVEI